MDCEVYFKTIFLRDRVRNTDSEVKKSCSMRRGQSKKAAETTWLHHVPSLPAIHSHPFPTHIVPTCSPRPIIQNNNKHNQQFVIISTTDQAWMSRPPLPFARQSTSVTSHHAKLQAGGEGGTSPREAPTVCLDCDD